MQSEKVRWARLSIASNTVLVLLKIAVGVLTGSVSVVAEGFHSAVDLGASVITYFAVRISGRPGDKDHHYGHGKVENLAGVAEGMLIFAGAGIIIWEAVPKLISGEGPESLSWGLGVMALSSAVNYGVSAKLFRMAKKTGSPALAADAWHLRTDVYTSAGVLGGLALMRITGKTFFDPVMALIVAAFILKTAYGITMEGLAHMVDVALPDEELEKVKASILRHGEEFVEFHELRARKSGSQRFIDLHLVMPRELPLSRVHDFCDLIEAEVERELPDSHVLIHAEPCETSCAACARSKGEGVPCVS